MTRATIPFTALALCGALAATPARTQNTADDWKWAVDHFSTFSLWESACDHRDLGQGRERRCYVRVVDVYAPRPDFGAAFVFITHTMAGGLRFEFSFEKGTTFEPGGFAVMRDGVSLFDHAPARCEAAHRCVISGDEADHFAAALAGGTCLRLAFTDASGRDWERLWNTEGIAGALADLQRESRARGL